MNENENNNIGASSDNQSNGTIMLNRERENIVQATIQANDAIDKQMAKNVNNAIKMKKRNPFLAFFIGIILVALAVFLAYLGLKLTKSYIKADDDLHTTTTTTTKKINILDSYINNFTKLRKFQSKDSILMLLPTMGNENNYIYLTISDNGILSKEEGLYLIENGKISLMSATQNREAIIGDKTIQLASDDLEINDQQVKYYINKEQNKLLIINGTLFNEFAYAFDGAGAFYSFTETTDAITLENGDKFLKNGINIIKDGLIYTFGE